MNTAIITMTDEQFFLAGAGFAVFLVAVAMFIIFVLEPYSEWRGSLDFSNPKLRFKEFLKLYNAQPHRWILGEKTVTLKGEKDTFGYDFKTFIDYLRYTAWKDRRKKNGERELYKSVRDQATAELNRLGR